MPVSDILITPATIYKGPVGEPLPSESTVDYGAPWGGNWDNLGYTLEPVGLSYDRTVFSLMVEQVTTAVRRQVESEEAAIETVLAELTADNLQLAIGGTATATPAAAGQRAYEEISAGGSINLDLYAWGFEGRYQDDAGAVFPVRVFVHKGTGILNGALTFAKAEAVGINLRVDVLADTGRPIGEQMITIQKITAAATDE